MRAIGLMSGTSLDGMDAALVRLRRVGASPDGYRVRLEAFVTIRYRSELRARLAAAAHGAPLQARAFSELDAALSEVARRAVEAVCRRGGVRARQVAVLGSHGQTIFHGPAAGAGRIGWQLGSPARIAAASGIATVGDFRTADLCAGGEGAPLMPLVHRMLLAHPRRARLVLNLGGIANVTWLGPRGEGILAFDTGPGVMLIDELVRRATRGRMALDRGGRLASRGAVDESLLAWLLDDAFLRRRPPKSTGRERYGAGLAPRFEARARRRGLSSEETVATATAFTAASVRDQYDRFLARRGNVDEVLVCGGGRRNRTLMRMLAERFAPVPVRPIESAGLAGDALEAIGFAVLAAASLDGVRFDLRAITGARSPVALGVLAPAGVWPRGLRGGRGAGRGGAAAGSPAR